MNAEYTVTPQEAITLHEGIQTGSVERYDEGNLDYYHVNVPEDSIANFEFRVQEMFPGFSGRFNFFDEEYKLMEDYSFDMSVGGTDYYPISWENTHSRDYTIYIMAESWSSGQYSIFLDIVSGIIDNPFPGGSAGEEEPNDSFSTSTIIEEGTMNGDIFMESYRDDDLFEIIIPRFSTMTISAHFTDHNEYYYYESGNANKYPSTHIGFHLVEDKDIDSFLEISNYYEAESCYLNRDEIDELTFENPQKTEQTIYLAIEGDGKYSIEIDHVGIQKNDNSENDFKLPELKIILMAGLGIIIIFFAILIIYGIKKSKDRRAIEDQMFEYHLDNAIYNNQSIDPQSYVVEAEVVEEIEYIDVQ